MNPFGLLLKSNIPSWIAVLIAIASMLVVALVKYLFDRRIRKLENQLNDASKRTEKILALVYERHSKRLDALDDLGWPLNEFEHAISHLKNGDSNYSDSLRRHYSKARELSRKHEPLLGKEFHDCVIEFTDTGIALLDAYFEVTEEAIEHLKIREMPKIIVDSLLPLCGKRIAVVDTSEIQEIFQTEEKFSLPIQYKDDVFSNLHISSEYNANAYQQSQSKLFDMRADLYRKLPKTEEFGRMI